MCRILKQAVRRYLLTPRSGVGTSEIELCSLVIVLAFTKFFWRFLRHIGTFLDHLGGLDTPVGRVQVPRHWAELSKYMGEWRDQYLSFY